MASLQIKDPSFTIYLNSFTRDTNIMVAHGGSAGKPERITIDDDF
jgi:hypothetical protein